MRTRPILLILATVALNNRGNGVSRADWLKWYEDKLAPLPLGVYQLTVHLGFDDDELRGATGDHPEWGAAWRQNDFEPRAQSRVPAVSARTRFHPRFLA